MDGWKQGLPPGPYYKGMEDDFEVYFSPAGIKWHRRRSDDEREEYKQMKAANRRDAEQQ